jgi:hypothetical protein
MVPVGLGLAAALIFFGPLLSWVAAAVAVGVMIFERLELKTENQIS